MFDIGWSEILVVAVVAVIVVGPKELPRMLRTFGKTMGTVRRTANDFKRQFDEALREAERAADLEDTRKQPQSLTKIDATGDRKAASSPSKAASPVIAAAPPPEPAPAAVQVPPAEAPPAQSAGPQSGTNAA